MSANSKSLVATRVAIMMNGEVLPVELGDISAMVYDDATVLQISLVLPPDEKVTGYLSAMEHLEVGLIADQRKQSDLPKLS